MINYKTYNSILQLAAPFIKGYLRYRIAIGKEDAIRYKERYGASNMPRPKGVLIWFHAISIGEASATLPLIARILEKYPYCHILVTTGTRTSATIMAEKLPARAIHQYAPWDHGEWVARFLDHWQPQCALWMEAEFWPNMLNYMRGIPIALINGRVSNRSAARWQRYARPMLRAMLQSFSLILTSDDDDAARLRSLGAQNIKPIGNIKNASMPLSADRQQLDKLWDSLGERPVWVAASTHPEDEAIIMKAHAQIIELYPDALCIIVPRHPVRGPEIGAIAKTYQHHYRLRSKGEVFCHSDTVYIADSLGELGLFYRLAPIAFIGGTMGDRGGHNALEA
ncbi:MAG: 3-deoxy-D-manno-octulosonic acid transferase, partial [Pseudomonadota bacterium]